MAWLAEYVGELYTRTHRGSDGKAPYELLKGKKPTTKIVPFGEKALYKKEKPRGQKHKFESNAFEFDTLMNCLP